jgi:selenocysteine lyase/cysteine desulfurase
MNSLGNAGRGVHEASLEAARTVFGARARLAELFNAEDVANIAFTSNSTEALNIAIKGVICPGDHVITTELEHNSVLRPIYELEEKGTEVSFVKACREDGTINYDDF